MSEPMKVFCRDGQAGWIKEITIDQATGRPIQLRLQLLSAENAGVLVSTLLVSGITSDEIRLKISLEELTVLTDCQWIQPKPSQAP
jgi:hypothetical protein